MIDKIVALNNCYFTFEKVVQWLTRSVGIVHTLFSLQNSTQALQVDVLFANLYQQSIIIRLIRQFQPSIEKIVCLSTPSLQACAGQQSKRVLILSPEERLQKENAELDRLVRGWASQIDKSQENTEDLKQTLGLGSSPRSSVSFNDGSNSPSTKPLSGKRGVADTVQVNGTATTSAPPTPTSAGERRNTFSSRTNRRTNSLVMHNETAILKTHTSIDESIKKGQLASLTKAVKEQSSNCELQITICQHNITNASGNESESVDKKTRFDTIKKALDEFHSYLLTLTSDSQLSQWKQSEKLLLCSCAFVALISKPLLVDADGRINMYLEGLMEDLEANRGEQFIARTLKDFIACVAIASDTGSAVSKLPSLSNARKEKLQQLVEELHAEPLKLVQISKKLTVSKLGNAAEIDEFERLIQEIKGKNEKRKGVGFITIFLFLCFFFFFSNFISFGNFM